MKKLILLSFLLIFGCFLFKSSYTCNVYIYWDDEDYSILLETVAGSEYYDAYSKEEAEEACEEEHGPYYDTNYGKKRLARCRCF